MTKEKTRRCIHCLKYFESVTDDHILPQSWYSQSNPPNFAKPQAPACSKCNAHYGKVEKYLLIRLGETFDSKDKNYGNIADKAIRSIDPKYGKNSRDKIAREKARSELVREIVPYFYSDRRNRFKRLISTPSLEIYRDDDPKIRSVDKVLGFYLIKIWDRLNICVSIKKHF